MGVGYKSVLWNSQKKKYDLLILLGVFTYLAIYSFLDFKLHPTITLETLIIRATGTLAFLMLHVILCIGPLTRLSAKFYPLLYNRRHLGVTMAVIALVHGLFSIVQFHSLGDVNPLVSLFTSNTHYNSLSRFPFQPLGFVALIIILLMAATSHDFWLKNLNPKVWKSLHMLVYLAYGLLVMHVMLGAFQWEQSFILAILLFGGMLIVIGLHLFSALKRNTHEVKIDESSVQEGFYKVCHISDIPENRAKVVLINDQNIAIF